MTPSQIVSGAVNIVSQNKGTVGWIGIGLIALVVAWQINPESKPPVSAPVVQEVKCPPAPVVHVPQAQKRQAPTPTRPQDRW